MQPEQAAEFLKYIGNIIGATQNGSMNWEAVNPTTFVWKKGAGLHTRIVLQRTSNTGSIVYTFQGIDSSNSVQINQSAVHTSELGAMLSSLFVEIRKSLDQKGLDFLKSIVPPTS
jgi:hypothetical protein